MTPQDFLPLISLLFGLAARVFIPWLIARRDNPEQAKWDWKYVWPQLLAFGIVLIVLPLVVADLDKIFSMQWQAAWLLGWGAADLGRKVAKNFQSE